MYQLLSLINQQTLSPYSLIGCQLVSWSNTTTSLVNFIPIVVTSIRTFQNNHFKIVWNQYEINSGSENQVKYLIWTKVFVESEVCTNCHYQCLMDGFKITHVTIILWWLIESLSAPAADWHLHILKLFNENVKLKYNDNCFNTHFALLHFFFNEVVL